MRSVRMRLLLLALIGARCGSSGPDGTDLGADATAALEQAITAADGGTVTLAGSGTYLVRSVVVGKARTTLVCTGKPTPATIQLQALAPGDGSPIFDVRADDFTLRNCILDGNRSAQPRGQFSDSFEGRAFRSGVKMDGRYHGLIVDKVTFRNVYGAAIASRNVSGISVTHSTFQDNGFEAVFADNSYTLGDPLRFLGGFSFVGNTVVNVGSRDPAVNANGLLVHQMADIRIEDNALTGYERSGIKLENCRSGTIANNRIHDGSIPNFAGVAMQNGAHDMTIRDNDIRNVGAGIDTSLVQAGQYPPDGVNDVTIRGNTIRSVKRGDIPDGIRILGYGPATADVTIADNTIQDVPRHGINLRQFRRYHPAPLFSRIKIQDNHLSSAGSCADWFSGSDVAPTAVTSSGNHCE